ncbi:hypothetical protein BKA70DRAFT_1448424 [Coprinopsis sp. MPI-PUGE-AT-0042]|nr:hypothetical protein BKA70DRAFT_1448424 [Coprinopsis sp. MPI-PUGE-AT-0042]
MMRAYAVGDMAVVKHDLRAPTKYGGALDGGRGFIFVMKLGDDEICPPGGMEGGLLKHEVYLILDEEPDKASVCWPRPSTKKVDIYEIGYPSNGPLVVFESHLTNIPAASLRSEGKWLVTGNEDGTIKICDLR